MNDPNKPKNAVLTVFPRHSSTWSPGEYMWSYIRALRCLSAFMSFDCAWASTHFFCGTSRLCSFGQCGAWPLRSHERAQTRETHRTQEQMERLVQVPFLPSQALIARLSKNYLLSLDSLLFVFGELLSWVHYIFHQYLMRFGAVFLTLVTQYHGSRRFLQTSLWTASHHQQIARLVEYY